MEQRQPLSRKASLVQSLRRRFGDRIADAFAMVPREEFVPADLADAAYEDAALSIGAGQTISQPTMIAIMLEAAELTPSDKVLDVGTGSGYQAALLAHLVAQVIGVELLPELVERARTTLHRLGYPVAVQQAREDVLGWPDDAPYDAILVAAAAESVPQALVEQLTEGGKLVVPVGGRAGQDLKRVTKTGTRVRTDSLGECAFVPLIAADA